MEAHLAASKQNKHVISSEPIAKVHETSTYHEIETKI